MTNQSATNVLEKLFSCPTFKSLDTAALTQQYGALSKINRAGLAAKPASSYLPLVGTTISNIPPQGILIDTPGTYQFSNNITWSPAEAGSAIFILASNVVLDLKGFTLTINQPAPNTGTQYNGITIGISDLDLTTCNAVTLQNGTIAGASYYGVCALQTSNLVINAITVSNISYSETVTADLTACGIFINSSDVFNVQNCVVQNITVTAPSCAGIQIVSATNGNVSGCTMQGFLNYDGGVQGYSYLESWNITTSSCVAENFRSHYKGLTNTTGHTVIGFVPIMCTNLAFNDCSATGMTGCCDDCHGMSVFLDSYVEVNNFKASNVLDGLCSAKTGAKATGLEIYGDYVTINNSSSNNIKAIVPQDLQSAGFSAWGSNNTFNNCVATDVAALDANQQPSTAHGYGVGFGWAPDPRTEGKFNSTAANLTQYNNCNANGCQVGFDTWYHTNSKWSNVMTQNCTIFILAQPAGTPRTLYMNRCSESPNGSPESVTITNIADNNTFPKLHT